MQLVHNIYQCKSTASYFKFVRYNLIIYYKFIKKNYYNKFKILQI